MKIDYYADYIFFNGAVITVNEKDEICQAVAARGKEIIYVGSTDDALVFQGPDTEMIDLHGKCALPGFIDGHLHVYSKCLREGGIIIDASAAVASSISEIKTLLKKLALEKKKSEAICIWGYDQNKLKERRHLTRKDLDEAAPDHPVLALRVCGHIGVVNSQTLQLVGIDERTTFDHPDEVGFDDDGRLNGMFKDSSMDLFTSKFSFSTETYYETFENVSKFLVQAGITGIHEMGGAEANCLQAMQKSVADGIFKPRVYLTYSNITSKENSQDAANCLIKYGPKSGLGNEHFKMGPIKFMLDGSTSGPSCYTKEPYCHDPSLKGIQSWKDQEELNAYVLKAHLAGFQICAHAVGDAAIEQLVTAYEYALKQGPKGDHRFRIEHCGITSPELIERIKNINAIVISNPSFLTINGADYNMIYGGRTERFFASKTYEKNGIIEGFGSDYPVSMTNPLHAIYGAVTRKDIARNIVCGESQKISVINAIRCHTYNNAYASFSEKIVGSLEVGKLADIVVLSENILDCPLEKIKDITIEKTMIDGIIEYSAY